ncbi:MAG: hypothetical protein RR635_08565 [Oscillospiraceae bacterium]
MKLTKRFMTLAVICMLVVAAFPLAAFATNEERVSVCASADRLASTMRMGI